MDLKDKKLRRKTPLDLGTMMYGKVPPQAKELEEAVLGAILIDKFAFDKVADLIQAECFYVDANQRIFQAAQRLVKKNQPIDLLTVVEELKREEELDAVGGPYYVTKLTNSVVSSANIEAHCRIVQQKFIQRELIRISGEIIGQAYEDGSDAFELLDEAESKILQIATTHLNNDYTNLIAGLSPVMQRIERLKKTDHHITGVPTGFSSIDRVTHGWQQTDLIIVAARPSVGKTAFALNLARNAASNGIKNTNVGFFSLEMSTGQLIQRILSMESEVPLDQIKSGNVQDDTLKRLYKTIDVSLGNMKIYIDDTAALNMFQLKSKARRMVNKDKCGLIIIDYLQLMNGEESRNGNREQEISKISRGLKTLAKTLQVPIIALSQLSRDIEKRSDPEPRLSDLRESGAIEQDADVVIFLYKPSEEAIRQDSILEPVRYVKIAKHRDGSLDQIELRANNSIQKWSEITT